MLLLTCPYCGPREECEFHFGGPANIPYPEAPQKVDDQGWADFLYFRDNALGTVLERWVHEAGCHQWVVVSRDTSTYRIQDVKLLREIGSEPSAYPPAGESA